MKFMCYKTGDMKVLGWDKPETKDTRWFNLFEMLWFGRFIETVEQELWRDWMKGNMNYFLLGKELLFRMMQNEK